ncbi:MAG: PDZ domain-containing protein [Deltaproteobacteria bacterium]|nr:PDZ domain-containing protein [Deltaproteobacteria bacterium]
MARRGGVVLLALLLSGCATLGSREPFLPRYEVVSHGGWLTTLLVDPMTTPAQLRALVLALREQRRTGEIRDLSPAARHRRGVVQVFTERAWADMEALSKRPVPFQEINRHVRAYYSWDRDQRVEWGFVGVPFEGDPLFRFSEGELAQPLPALAGKIRTSPRPVEPDLAGAVLKARLLTFYQNGRPSGAPVAEILPESPLYRLGLRQGDLIRAVNEQAVDTGEEAVRRLTGLLQAGGRIVLEVQRGVRWLTLGGS